jgi:SAM-dependent methyltransferase
MPSFICPVDHGELRATSSGLSCLRCGRTFPVVNGVPVLLNEENSVFRIADYTSGQAYMGASGYGGTADRTTGLKRAYRAFARSLSEAPIPGHDFDPMEVILAEKPDAEVLVIGSGERERRGHITYTDVAFARNVHCICDAHDLPFPDGKFDAVLAEAVLEHVCDPQRCVAEITRVLKPQGMVWAVTPFLQPVHMGAYDFTRFTHLGHRRLFRRFDELRSGMEGGPGYSATHLLRNLFLALSDRPKIRAGLRLGALLVTYPLRYLDRFFSRTEGAYNAGCAFYFLGRKREHPIPDRDILAMFRGR